MLVAAALRFAGLGRFPAGLYRDEAYYGLDAVNVLHGQHAIYFPANNGREPMFIYLLTLSIGLLGRSPFAVRLPAAIISLLTVPATYLMARELFNRRVGLLAAAVLAVTLWPVHLAHVGFRVGLLPLFAALTVWQAARAWTADRGRQTAGDELQSSEISGRWSGWGWLVAGALYGLCFYTYLAVRFTPLIIAVFALYVWLVYPRERAALIKAAVPFALSALIVVAPLAVYAVGHWDIFMGRGGQVLFTNPDIGGSNPWMTLAGNIVRALGMFFWRGDFSPRQNVPYRPVFDVLTSVCFVMGLVWALIRARRDAACALALIWTAVMLLPTILAEDTPHFLRSVGVLPVIAVFPALLLSWVWDFGRKVSARPVVDLLQIAAVLAFGLVSTSLDYFRYTRDESVRFWFDDAGVQKAIEINRFTGSGWTGNEWSVSNGPPAPDRRVFIDRSLWDGPDNANTRFLVPAQSALTFIKTGGDLPMPGTGPTLLVLWPYEDWRRDMALLPRQSVIEFREGAQSKGDRDKEPIVNYLVVSAEPYTSVPQPLARFQNGVQLVGAQVVGTRVRLMWHAPQTPEADYAVFVHARRGDAVVAQHDGDPASGLYPMTQWRPGDMVIDEHSLVGAWEAGRDQIVVGLYRRETGTRLPVVNEAGVVLGDSAPIKN